MVRIIWILAIIPYAVADMVKALFGKSKMDKYRDSM